MDDYDWVDHVKQLYEKALQQYQAGNRKVTTYFTKVEQAELASIGGRAVELYDYAEDVDQLSWETALLILSVRRDYFLQVQQGELSSGLLRIEEFPAKQDQLDGIAWLPRLILKAKTRLSGQLPSELMYNCGGDRKFFREHRIHPADFLRFIWTAKGDEACILDYVKRSKLRATKLS
jgi:hypothetical protein